MIGHRLERARDTRWRYLAALDGLQSLGMTDLEALDRFNENRRPHPEGFPWQPYRIDDDLLRRSVTELDSTERRFHTTLFGMIGKVGRPLMHWRGDEEDKVNEDYELGLITEHERAAAIDRVRFNPPPAIFEEWLGEMGQVQAELVQLIEKIDLRLDELEW